MHYVKQNNYDTFACIADKCPESCCIGWQIVIDENSMENYQQMEGRMGERLRQSIDTEESCFHQNGIRCAMLNDRNLCDLQLACGHETLCKTCQDFPRHLEEYEDVRELSLSLTCPEAVRMLFAMKEPLGLTEWDTEDEYDDLEDYEDFDDLLYDKLLYLREVSYKIIRDQNKPLKARMEQLLDLSTSLQEMLDEGDIFGMDDCLDDYESIETVPETYASAKNHYSVLYELETLHGDWVSDLDRVWNACFDNDNESLWSGYLNLSPELEFAGEQILFSLIYVYLCGAVYDDWIYSKMALCVYMVRWILLSYHVQVQDHTKTDWDLLTVITYRLTREIENSDPNLDALEEFFSENM